MIGKLIDVFAGDGGIIDTVADKVAPDADLKPKLKAEFRNQVIAQAGKLRQARASIVRAEARSEHKLAAVWRPVLMLIFAAILANNYVIAPYVQVIFGEAVTLPVPDQLWQLIKLGVGGYIAGRSGEKIMDRFKRGDDA